MLESKTHADVLGTDEEEEEASDQRQQQKGKRGKHSLAEKFKGREGREDVLVLVHIIVFTGTHVQRANKLTETHRVRERERNPHDY